MGLDASQFGDGLPCPVLNPAVLAVQNLAHGSLRLPPHLGPLVVGIARGCVVQTPSRLRPLCYAEMKRLNMQLPPCRQPGEVFRRYPQTLVWGRQGQYWRCTRGWESQDAGNYPVNEPLDEGQAVNLRQFCSLFIEGIETVQSQLEISLGLFRLLLPATQVPKGDAGVLLSVLIPFAHDHHGCVPADRTDVGRDDVQRGTTVMASAQEEVRKLHIALADHNLLGQASGQENLLSALQASGGLIPHFQSHISNYFVQDAEGLGVLEGPIVLAHNSQNVTIGQAASGKVARFVILSLCTESIQRDNLHQPIQFGCLDGVHTVGSILN